MTNVYKIILLVNHCNVECLKHKSIHTKKHNHLGPERISLDAKIVKKVQSATALTTISPQTNNTINQTESILSMLTSVVKIGDRK